MELLELVQLVKRMRQAQALREHVESSNRPPSIVNQRCHDAQIVVDRWLAEWDAHEEEVNERAG